MFAHTALGASLQLVDVEILAPMPDATSVAFGASDHLVDLLAMALVVASTVTPALSTVSTAAA